MRHDAVTVSHPAAETDLPAVRRLLEAAHLPLDGVDQHLATMVVAKDGSGVMGAAAVELYADGALCDQLSSVRLFRIAVLAAS